MTLFDPAGVSCDDLSCDEFVPFGIHELCLTCGAVFDTTSKRKREFIGYTAAWRVQRERERHERA